MSVQDYDQAVEEVGALRLSRRGREGGKVSEATTEERAGRYLEFFPRAREGVDLVLYCLHGQVELEILNPTRR